MSRPSILLCVILVSMTIFDLLLSSVNDRDIDVSVWADDARF